MVSNFKQGIQIANRYKWNAVFTILSAAIFQMVLFGRMNAIDSLLLIGAFGYFSSKKIASRWVYGFSAFFAIFLPVTLVTKGGLLTPVILDVLVSTNTSEAWDFISVLPIRFILIACTVIVSLTVVFWFSFKTKKTSANVKGFICLVALMLGLCVNHWTSFLNIKTEYDRLSVDTFPDSDWEIIGKTGKQFDTYVLVIGESMRSDFMSMYGYKYPTTPFLDSVSKIYFKNYVASGVNTAIALPYSLAKFNNEDRFEVQNNIISLAKKAGLRTYWISGQGFSGNGIISQVANFADEKFFTKKDDYDLLPVIERALKDPTRKLVVIHLFGSHENACNRIKNYGMPIKTGAGKTIDCYASSIHKTDNLLKIINEQLAGQEFSMIYFSDHGMNFIGKAPKYEVLRDDGVQTSYMIPFVLLSSDLTTSQSINANRSANSFFDYYPTWLGLRTNVTRSSDRFLSESSDEVQVLGYERALIYNDLKPGIRALEH